MAGDDEKSWCCPHPDDDHLICGYPDVELNMPVGGWRECPVDECDCRTTWSFELQRIDELRRMKNTDSRVHGKKCKHCPGIYRVDSVGSMFDYVYVTCVRCEKEAIV